MDSQLCALQLTHAANAAGGLDNITVIVVNVEGLQPTKQRKLARRTKITIAIIVVLLLAILGGGIWGGYTYLHTSAYLGVENGKVAIYQGVPGDVLGFTYSELLEVTDIDVKLLPPSAQARVEEGLRVADLEEAQELVESYRESFVETRQSSAETTGTGPSASGTTQGAGTTQGEGSTQGSNSSSAAGTATGAGAQGGGTGSPSSEGAA